MKMSDRKRKILQIVVDEYINTAVPVSSKSITEKHLTGVSSATVRNELASLEELGYLTQFHTSGGRVPSPQAYRFYIEELMQKSDLSERDLDYIRQTFSRRSNDVEHLIKDVAKVISELTDYTSVGIGPHDGEETIRSLALLYCGERRALCARRPGASARRLLPEPLPLRRRATRTPSDRVSWNAGKAESRARATNGKAPWRNPRRTKAALALHRTTRRSGSA